MLEPESIVHEARGKGFFQSTELAVVERGRNDFDGEAAEAERAPTGFRCHADTQPLGRQSPDFEILDHVLADAAAEGDQQKFGGGHSLIGRSVFTGLIKLDAMLTCLRAETRTTAVLQSNFQANPPESTELKSTFTANCGLLQNMRVRRDRGVPAGSGTAPEGAPRNAPA